MKKIETLKNGRVRVTTEFKDPSLAQQQFADETNINKIMKKYHANGTITHLNRKQGFYGDVSSPKSYQQSIQTVIDAQTSFMTLPSEVRKKFGNDPYEVLKFLSDPKNKDEAITLGLIPKPEKPTAAKLLAAKNDDSNDDHSA